MLAAASAGIIASSRLDPAEGRPRKASPLHLSPLFSAAGGSSDCGCAAKEVSFEHCQSHVFRG